MFTVAMDTRTILAVSVLAVGIDTRIVHTTGCVRCAPVGCLGLSDAHQIKLTEVLFGSFTGRGHPPQEQRRRRFPRRRQKTSPAKLLFPHSFAPIG